MNIDDKKIAIDLLDEEALKDFKIEELESLQSYMHTVSNTLKSKQALVARVQEVKELQAQAAKKLSNLSDGEKNALRAELDKPVTQSLIGDHITKDADQVNPGA